MAITSLLAAGIPPGDDRIQGALKWLSQHYSLDVHPGMARPNEGLYLYYYAFAKAMRALGRDQLRDARGLDHDWRDELEQRLASQQKPDGSWANPEESPEIARCGPVTITSYALLTLGQIRESRGADGRRRQRPRLVGNITP